MIDIYLINKVISIETNNLAIFINASLVFFVTVLPVTLQSINISYCIFMQDTMKIEEKLKRF